MTPSRLRVGGSLGGRTFASLRNHRNYRLNFSGQLVAMCGSQMAIVADAWLILKLTGTPFSLGVLVVAQYLPFTIFGLFAGVVVDRSEPRNVIIGTQCSLLTIAAIMAGLVLAGVVRPWEVYFAASVAGALRVLEGSARQALLVQMVGRRELPNAIALNSSLFSAGRVVGPGIGGALIAGFGIGWVYMVNAFTFVPILAALFALRPREFHELQRHGRPPVLRGIVEGFAHVRRTPVAFVILTSVVTFSFFMANTAVFLPTLSRMLGGGAGLFGLFMSCFGLGSTVGALVAAMLGRAMLRTFLIGAGGMGSAELLIAIHPTLPSGVILLFVAGFCFILWTATGNTIVQLTAPDSMQGRASSLFTFSFIGVSAFGGLFLGTLASISGVLLFAVAGTAGIAFTLLTAVRLRGLEVVPAAGTVAATPAAAT